MCSAEARPAYSGMDPQNVTNVRAQLDDIDGCRHWHDTEDYGKGNQLMLKDSRRSTGSVPVCRLAALILIGLWVASGVLLAPTFEVVRSFALAPNDRAPARLGATKRR